MKYFIAILMLFVAGFCADIPARPDQRPFDPKVTKFSISSVYGMRSLNGETKRFHSGIDYAIYLDSEVTAAGSGEIIFSRSCGNYGNLIIIRHDWTLEDGTKKTAFTYYAHLVEFLKLKGELVDKGELIALSGATGNADGAGIHFEVRNENMLPIWPGTYMAEKRLEQ